MGSMSGHAAMAYHPPKSAYMSVSGTHIPMSQLNMAEMSMTSTTAMAKKRRGHATMADAMRAHPELAKMGKAMMRDMVKMRGHATMTDAMRAHPELAKMS